LVVGGAGVSVAPELPLPVPPREWPYGQGSPFGVRGAVLWVVLGAVELCVCAGGALGVEEEDEPLLVAAPAPAIPAAAPAVAHAAAMAPAFTIRLMLTGAPWVDFGRLPAARGPTLARACRENVGGT
jgi:hypothetical protein